jgi:elongator complex protein 3
MNKLKLDNMFNFDPVKHKKKLQNILEELDSIPSKQKLDGDLLRKISKKNPKNDKGLFSKDELLQGYKLLRKTDEIPKSNRLECFLQTKPTRSISGVTPVTVLTKPYHCPGKCIYCPEIDNMPKSYIPSEPGAQRALLNQFDPFTQTYNRLLALHKIGHPIDKIELIIIGGTWSAYPLTYQIWFIKECFRALNTFEPNQKYIKREYPKNDISNWDNLYRQHETNQSANARCVGLSLETRPDLMSKNELIKLRKLGATKIQIGIQILDDKILQVNRRGHTTSAIKKCFRLLRLAGFKIQAHIMPNLYQSTPQKDMNSYKRLWQKPYQPDELKIYPTSVIKNTELYKLYQEQKYKPYTQQELMELIQKMMLETPRYCRITRVIRDIPQQEIEAGSKTTNLRQIIHQDMAAKGLECKCIRCREIRDQSFSLEDLSREIIRYETSIGSDYFLSFKTSDDKIIGFLRLTIPSKKNQKAHFIKELRHNSIIREIHVYGQTTQIGHENNKTPQHLGLGRQLIDWAEKISRKNIVSSIAVISAIGTRKYYKKRGFKRNCLYMVKSLN